DERCCGLPRPGAGVNLSVIVATYEWPEALDAVLRGLADQSDRDFELVVADDGSGPATFEVVHSSSEQRPLRHVRQEDEGYRLARVRNLGAREAGGDFLVFLDGDVVPRRHFVRAMRRSAVTGWFVAGKRLLLGRELTARTLTDRLPIQRWSLLHWALHHDQAGPLRAL